MKSKAEAYAAIAAAVEMLDKSGFARELTISKKGAK